jgi:hypothetical protein
VREGADLYFRHYDSDVYRQLMTATALDYGTALSFFGGGIFASADYRSPGGKLNASAGLRADGASYSDNTASFWKQLSPRVSLSYLPWESWSFNASAGFYHQLPPITALGFRTASGSLDIGRVWRGLYLDDDKVFTCILQTDPGDLCVDILLDASYSQVNRQAMVSAQGYMIAEALTRCRIPVRVSSFCSISGYTILTRYRDYLEWDNNHRIFHFFTSGCNRDGLALRIMRQEMEAAPCEHKILILLSDARPHDIIQFYQNGQYVNYNEENSIMNTAAEVRSLQHHGIAVICVFTGDDEDVPAAHTIYGRNFARIRHLEQFADTVGTLIQNQIRSL